ncbi:MAG: DUF2007 domain-containing protein [Methyloligellaceae bacterium]
MNELLRTNNQVLLSFVKALLGEAGIEHAVLDTHMSIVEGSLGILPQRVLVSDEDLARAQRLLRDAGVEHGGEGEWT